VTVLGAALPAGVRALAADAWRFRWRVERDAEARFDLLARRLDALGPSARLAPLARRAAADERRHAVHCARLAAELGAPVAEPPPPLVPVAPPGLEEADAVTYEVVAACCIAESVSVAVLTALLPAARAPGLREVLHELAADEVVHARLGWAHLSLAAARGGVAFLAPLLPAMLAGSVDEDLFGAVEPAREDEALLLAGVLPHGQKRALWVGALEEVVLPGLAGAGVDVGAAREWLSRARHPVTRAGRPPRP
jgi:hypothetical protein